MASCLNLSCRAGAQPPLERSFQSEHPERAVVAATAELGMLRGARSIYLEIIIRVADITEIREKRDALAEIIFGLDVNIEPLRSPIIGAGFDAVSSADFAAALPAPIIPVCAHVVFFPRQA